jgi:hypothetical protein
MRRAYRSAALGLVLVGALAAGGCGQEVKKENEQLKAQVASLQKENTDLKGQATSLKADADALKKQLDDLTQQKQALEDQVKAAEAAGLNVARTRILATVVGGAFIGMSGAYLSVVLSNYFVRSMTRGLGFIALSAVIAGAWSPAWVLGVSILFGLSWGVYVQFNAAIGLTFLFGSLPYLVTVAVLSVASRRLRPPAALALPYRKE